MTTIKYNPKDFFIQLAPLLDSQGNWVGEIDINLMVHPKSPLNPQDFEEIYKIQKLMSISLSLFEEFSHVKELAEWSLRTKENSASEDTTVIKEPSVVESDGNVLTVDFTSHKKNYDA